jgi:hypothetical protein
MRPGSAAAFRTALEARLQAEQGDGVGISRLRKRVVFERLLARLEAVAPEGWYLKGGFALELRLGATLADGYATAARLWDPVLAAEITSGTWAAEPGV